MFIVIEIQKTSDENVATIVNQYSNHAQADSAYHMILAAAAISEIPVHSAIIMDEYGSLIASASYTH